MSARSYHLLSASFWLTINVLVPKYTIYLQQSYVWVPWSIL